MLNVHGFWKGTGNRFDSNTRQCLGLLFKKCFYLCVCVRMYVFVCVYVFVCECVRVCVEDRGRVGIGYLPPSLTTLFFETGARAEPGAH